MILEWIEILQNHGSPKYFFYGAEFSLVLLFLLFIGWKQLRGPESNFKVREADLSDIRVQSESQANRSADLGSAKMTRGSLLLEGIRLGGAPHEVLGVSSGANGAEIQKAYRKLMKRYHPDRVGPPGSSEWKDAQKIAEAINQAKDDLITRLKKNGNG